MLLSRRFFPYFSVQTLGALNDNVFKNVLLLLAAWSQTEQLPFSIDIFINLAAALFILPFLLFSSHAGFLADTLDKALLIRRLKYLELIIMSFGAIAMLTNSYTWLLLLLFAMGVQSAYFGPVKYALLPQLLTNEKDLVRGNAWVEVGTFLAILIGTLSAGLLMESSAPTKMAVFAILSIAMLGVIAARFVPSLSPTSQQTSRFNTIALVKHVFAQQKLWRTLMAISWFWFIGAVYLTQFPRFVESVLYSTPAMFSVLLILFSSGIGFGSLLSAQINAGQINLKQVPIGLLGLSITGLALVFFASQVDVTREAYSLAYFFGGITQWPLLISIFLIGCFGGLYIVPLYAYIQQQAAADERAQVIAVVNIMNAVFMIASAILSMLLLGVAQIGILGLFAVLAICSLFALILLLKKPLA